MLLMVYKLFLRGLFGLKKILSFILLVFLCLIAYTPSNMPMMFNLAPSTYFRNTFREIRSEHNETDIEVLKNEIAKADNTVAFISYRYKPNKDKNYNLSMLDNSLVLDEDSQLKLALKYLDNHKAAPVFVVRESEIASLRARLQILFRDRNFILLPCGDTYERWPLLEDQYSRYADSQWSNTGSLLSKLNTKKALYVGDEAAEVLSRKQLSGTLYDSNKSKVTYTDILAQYAQLTPELKKALLNSGSVQHLANREDLPQDVIRSIVRMDEYFLFKSLLSNDHIEPNVLLEVLEQEMEIVSPRTYESMLEFLFKDGKENNMELKQGLFYIVCKNIDSLSDRIQYTDINVFNTTWHLGGEVAADMFNALYVKGFSDWDKIFKGDTFSKRQQEMMLPLVKKYSIVAADIISSLAKDNITYLFEIVGWLETTDFSDFSKLLLMVVDKTESLKDLKDIFSRNEIPERVKLFALVRAFKDENPREYIKAINDYFNQDEVKNILGNTKIRGDIHSGLNLWLSVIALNPNVSLLMQEERENLPSELNGDMTKFASDKRNYDFLEAYLKFFQNTLSSESSIAVNEMPDILIKTINASMVIPSPDAISVFDDILDVWSNPQNSKIFDLNNYKNLSLPARYAVARTGDSLFAETVNNIYGFEELKSHRGSRFKVSSVLLNPNIISFKNVLANIFESLLADADSKNSRGSLIAICENLWLFMTLPDAADIAGKLNDQFEIAKQEFSEKYSKLSVGKNILVMLRSEFIHTLGTFWNMEIRKDLPIDTVYQRLSDIESFWTYYAQWKTLLNGKSGDVDVLDAIDILKQAVQIYLNTGKDIKELKYGGTPESAKQLHIMKLLLTELWGDTLNAEDLIERQQQDLHHRVKLKSGKVLNCYAKDTLPFWLNRGYFGGGTCASPNSSPGYTKCVNGVTFSALSRRVVVSPTIDGKEAIVSETKAITDIDGKKVPVVLNEHLYIAPTLPKGLTKGDISEAAAIASFKNAAIYGIPYLFFVEENTNMSEPTNFSYMEKYDGYNTEIEYVDAAGDVVKQQITVKIVKSDKRRTFYHLKENNRWKYTDNALYVVSDDGRMEKTYENMNTIDFKSNGVEGEIAGENCEYVANVLGGSLLSIETKTISVSKVDAVDRFKKMYPEYDADQMNQKVKALEERIANEELVIIANETLQDERTKGKETTLNLIKTIEDSGVAADYYLSKVYKLSSSMGKVVSENLNDLLTDASKKKLMVGIPRAGIPIASRIKKVLKTKALNMNYEIMDADRNIYSNHVTAGDLDSVFLCDQVINTGKTLGKNIELVLQNNPNADIYVLAPVTADPNAVMRLYRKYPQIKKIYIGDIRRRVESKKGISSPVGHPGERSYPQDYEALFEKGNIVKVQDRKFKVIDVFQGSFFKRTFEVMDVDSGELFRLKIMVSTEEGLLEESISALAKEEGFGRKTLVEDVAFYPQNAFLLSPYIKGPTLVEASQDTVSAQSYKLNMLLRDFKYTLKLFKKYNRFDNGFAPDSLMWDENTHNWKITAFFNSVIPSEKVSEGDMLSSIYIILDFVKENFKEIPINILKIFTALDTGKISDIDSLIIALEDLNLEQTGESYARAAA